MFNYKIFFMKRISLIITCLFVIIFSITAQDTSNQLTTAGPAPQEGTITYDKTQVPCQVIEMPVNEDVAKEAIKKRLMNNVRTCII